MKLLVENWHRYLTESSLTLKDYEKIEEEIFDGMGRSLYDHAHLVWDVKGGIPKKKRGYRDPVSKKPFFVPHHYDLKGSQYKLREAVHPDHPLADLVGRKLVIGPSIADEFPNEKKERFESIVGLEGEIKNLKYVHHRSRPRIRLHVESEWGHPIGNLQNVGGNILKSGELHWLSDLRWIKLV